jgi:23S rRNA (uridine2552-2'-O)-methyltransferase
VSKLRDPHHRHDAFFKKARGAGFAARSVYKLEEIDRKLRLLHRGDRVLDLGCRPGSWMQYALKVVGPSGAVVGIDRDPLPQAIAGARVLCADIYTTPDAELLGPLAAFDVVLSDMAPNTTGVRSTDQASRAPTSRGCASGSRPGSRRYARSSRRAHGRRASRST